MWQGILTCGTATCRKKSHVMWSSNAECLRHPGNHLHLQMEELRSGILFMEHCKLFIAKPVSSRQFPSFFSHCRCLLKGAGIIQISNKSYVLCYKFVCNEVHRNCLAGSDQDPVSSVLFPRWLLIAAPYWWSCVCSNYSAVAKPSSPGKTMTNHLLLCMVHSYCLSLGSIQIVAV